MNHWEVLNFQFRVVWKDGSYNCNGWFVNPKIKVEEIKSVPEEFKKELNKLVYIDDLSGQRFVPKPYKPY